MQEENPRTPDIKARKVSSKSRFATFNMVQAQQQIPFNNDEVERLHSQSFEDTRGGQQCKSPVPTPRELKTVHRMNRKHEESDPEGSSVSGVPAPERLIEKTHSDISYVPYSRPAGVNAFDDQRTEMGAASNNDAYTSYSGYNN